MLKSMWKIISGYTIGVKMFANNYACICSLRLFLFCFVASRPKSTAMVIAGRSVHLNTLSLGKLEQAVNQYFVHILSLVTDNNPS